MAVNYNSQGFCIICGQQGMLLPLARKCESCNRKINSAKAKTKLQDPLFRAKRNAQSCEYQKELRKDPKIRDKLNARQNELKKILKQDLVYREKLKVYNKATYDHNRRDPESKEKVITKAKEYIQKCKNEDPEFIAKKNAQAKKAKQKRMKDPNYRIKINVQKRVWEQKQMQDPDYRSKSNSKQIAYRHKQMIKQNQQSLFAIKLELDRQSIGNDVKS